METPSMVMYAALKRFGLSNREAASLLLNTRLTFDGHMIKSRIDDSSQLSRRIVRTAPGELSIGLFNNFSLTCPRLASLLAEKRALKSCSGDINRASRELADELSGTCASAMAASLAVHGIDEFMYRNMVTYINHVELSDETGRTTLHLMLFVATGCIGNPETASLLTLDYAAQFLGADYQTAPTVISNVPSSSAGERNKGIGLVRMVDNRIVAGTRTHVLNPDGTEIGLFPQSRHTVADVGDDASRRHAYIWCEDDRWLVKDLGSTNGTQVIAGSSGEVTTLEPNGEPCELHPTDILCLGATTRFLTMPILE